MLEDCPDLRREIGLKSTPDHNTLCNAFKRIVSKGLANKMLDQTITWAKERKLILKKVAIAAIDSTAFESRHVSRHFEKRKQQTAKENAKKRRKNKGGNDKGTANQRRSKTVRSLPKLSLAVDCKTHLILAVRATTGMGADHPHFEPLLFDAWRRTGVHHVVADAGYDSEANHSLARDDMNVRSIMPATHGRPTKKAPKGRHRRNMWYRFKRAADKPIYGQRWQVETVNSMLKRNMGSALRAVTARRRSKELLLRVVTHNIMILAEIED